MSRTAHWPARPAAAPSAARAAGLSAVVCTVLATAGCSAATAGPAPSQSVAPQPVAPQPVAPQPVAAHAAGAPGSTPSLARPTPSVRSTRTAPWPRAVARTPAAPTARPTRAAAPATCAADRLVPALVRTTGGAGSSYAVFSLTNHGGVACTVRGFPSLAFRDASGHPLDVVEQHGTAVPAGEVLLRPGSAAYTATRVSLVACDADPVPAAEVVLSPPGGAGSALRVRSLPVCVGGPLLVSALAARA